MKAEMRNTVKQLKHEISGHRLAQATYEDLAVLIEAHKTGDYAAAHQTILYKNHGAEYCEYLSILSF